MSQITMLPQEEALSQTRASSENSFLTFKRACCVAGVGSRVPINCGMPTFPSRILDLQLPGLKVITRNPSKHQDDSATRVPATQCV
jgi:hypothetical protein